MDAPSRAGGGRSGCGLGKAACDLLDFDDNLSRAVMSCKEHLPLGLGGRSGSFLTLPLCRDRNHAMHEAVLGIAVSKMMV